MLERNKQYWAALPKEELLDEAHKRIEEFYDDLQATGLFYIIEKSYRAYYGSNLTGRSQNGFQLFDSSELTRGGKNGEITMLKTNHYRNLIKHTLQLGTSQKTAITCRATNTDYKSQAQTILGRGIVDYYIAEKKVGRRRSQTVEYGLVTSEGWMHCPWNPTKGTQYDVHPETGAPIFEGDLEFSTGTILDVVRDISLTDGQENDWLMVRETENKYDLAAKYKDMSEDILSESSSQKYEDYDSFKLQIRKGDMPDSDRIVKWTLYHKKTDSMPYGRMTVFTSSKILFDGPIPYSQIPLYRFAPENLIGTPYGYSPAFELLGPQQGLDILSSTVMTNNTTLGVQSVWTKRGDNLSVTPLGGGMKNIQSDEMPQPLQLTKTAPETYDFRKQLVSEMETLAGISATVRGNPEANLKSGSALALVVSQSIQFAYLIEESANTLLEDVGTAIIMQLREFGKTPRVANIIGKSSRPFQKQFTGDDLSQVNRVVVEQVSPLSKTVAGRIEIANNLLQQGMIKDSNQYIMVLTTGQIDPAIEGVQHQLLNVRAENEEMREGHAVKVIVTDLHATHIQEHSDLLANPEARKNPKFLALVLGHIQEHLDVWRSADPAVLMVTGQQPPPPPQSANQMSAPQQPPQGGPEAGASGGPSTVQVGAKPGNPLANQMPSEPNLPNVPPGAPPQAQMALDQANMNQPAAS